MPVIRCMTGISIGRSSLKSLINALIGVKDSLRMQPHVRDFRHLAVILIHTRKTCVMRKSLLVTVFAMSIVWGAFAQSEEYKAQNDKFDVDVVYNTRNDFGLGYNFFVGDAEDFRTTIRGFGSGTVFDLFSGRYSADILSVGWDKVNLTLGLGLTLTKYRLSEPIRFVEENGVYGYAFDDDVNPTHDYGSGFFSDDKSKLVMFSMIVPANINFDLGKFVVSAGGTMDVYLTGKHKLKYHEDGDKEKEVIKNNDFNDYPLNKIKWGLSFMSYHKGTGLSISATYMLTPFFKEGPTSDFPELHEMRVSIGYNFSKKNYDKWRHHGNDI